MQCSYSSSNSSNNTSSSAISFLYVICYLQDKLTMSNDLWFYYRPRNDLLCVEWDVKLAKLKLMILLESIHCSEHFMLLQWLSFCGYLCFLLYGDVAAHIQATTQDLSDVSTNRRNNPPPPGAVVAFIVILVLDTKLPTYLLTFYFTYIVA